MKSDQKPNGALKRLVRRMFSWGWKLAIVAAIAAVVVYRLRFAPVAVESRAVALGPITSEVTGTGTLEPRVQATISAKISGRIAQVLADQGDRVTKGQLLATLDDGDLRQQVAIAKADLDATKAGVDRAGAEIASAEATAVLARSELARVTELRRTNAATPFEQDQATERRDVAQAELKRAQLARIEVEKQVLKGEETLRYNQERLADTKITSPFDGLVIRRTREQGDIVVPGSPILQVISTDQMWVSAWVDESALSSLAMAQPARVVFRSDPDKPCVGTVTRLAPLADRETREFTVDVTIKDLPRTWTVGQRAEVYIQTAQKDQALLAPQRAIVWRGLGDRRDTGEGRPGLFVSDGGHARWRSVELGLRGSESVEITKGLSAGETVIWLADPKSAPLTEGRAVDAAVKKVDAP